MLNGNMAIDDVLDELTASKQDLTEDIKSMKLKKFNDQYAQLIKISSWDFAPVLTEQKEKEAKERQKPKQIQQVWVEKETEKVPEKKAAANFLVKSVKRSTKG